MRKLFYWFCFIFASASLVMGCGSGLNNADRLPLASESEKSSGKPKKIRTQDFEKTDPDGNVVFLKHLTLAHFDIDNSIEFNSITPIAADSLFSFAITTEFPTATFSVSSYLKLTLGQTYDANICKSALYQDTIPTFADLPYEGEVFYCLKVIIDKQVSYMRTPVLTVVNEVADVLLTPSVAFDIAEGSQIENGAISAKILIDAQDFTSMAITSNQDCSGELKFIPVATEITDYQAQVSASNQISVFAIFRDRFNRNSKCVGDALTLEQLFQNSSFKINGGSQETDSTQLTFTFDNPQAEQMYITLTDSTCATGGGWEPYQAEVSRTYPSNLKSPITVYVKLRDDLLRESPCMSQAINYIAGAPQGATFEINDGDPTTALQIVTLSLYSGDNANKVYITNEAGCESGGTWETYQTVRSWILPTSNVSNTVYAKFADKYNNVSECVADSIVHDDINPTAPSQISSDSLVSFSQLQPVSWAAAADAGSGLSHYELGVGSDDSKTGSSVVNVLNWVNIGNVTSYDFDTSSVSLSIDTDYFLKVRAVDKAGNASDLLVSSAFQIHRATSSQFLKSASVASNAHWGESLDVAQDVMVVGGQGLTAVDVYRKQNGNWVYEATLTPFYASGSADSTDLFGQTGVATNGTFIAVAAMNEDSDFTGVQSASNDNANTADSGAVFLYKYNGSSWEAKSYIKAPKAVASYQFGSSIAMQSDTLIVGAVGDPSDTTSVINGTGAAADTNLVSVGAAHVYRYDSGSDSWAQEAYLKAPLAQTGMNFGTQVAVYGEYAAVSSLDDSLTYGIYPANAQPTYNGNIDGVGGVYVFKRASNSWALHTVVKPPTQMLSHPGEIQFGKYGLAMSSERLAVSSESSTANSLTSLAVYSRSEDVYSLETVIENPQETLARVAGTPRFSDFSFSEDGLTLALSSSGSTSFNLEGPIYKLADFSNQTNSDGNLLPGAVFLYHFTQNIWKFKSAVVPSEKDNGDGIGHRVRLYSDQIIFTGNGEDSSNSSDPTNNGSIDAGVVYVFDY